TNEIWLYSPREQFIGIDNDVEAASVNLGRNFVAGTELVFGIFVRDTEKTYKMGPASRNPDNFVHAKVEFLTPTSARVRFEDLDGGGDQNYNDAVFTVSGGIRYY